MKEVTVKKASALIQTNAKELTLLQRKIVNAFIYVAQQKGNQKRYYVPTVLLKDYCAIKTKGNDDLKEQLKSLLGIVLEFNYLNKDKKKVWEATVLVSCAKIEENSEYTEFEFSECLKEKILRPDLYTPLNVVLIAGLSCKYSIVLYEFLKDYETSPVMPLLELRKFRNLLGIEDEKYTEFQNFKKRVLDKAVKEINSKTDIECSYELIKGVGNVYSHIQLHVSKKKTLPEQLRPITQLELSFNGGESSHTEDVKVSAAVPPEPPRTEERDRELDPVHVEISERLKMKPELVSSLVDKHGLDKVKRVMEFTLAEPRKSVSGFFIKALEEGYFIPGPELQAVKSGDDALQKERISALRYEAHKCFSTQGGPGDCGIHDRTNPGSPCCYCKKWNRNTQSSNVFFAQI